MQGVVKAYLFRLLDQASDKDVDEMFNANGT